MLPSAWTALPCRRQVWWPSQTCSHELCVARLLWLVTRFGRQERSTGVERGARSSRLKNSPHGPSTFVPCESCLRSSWGLARCGVASVSAITLQESGKGRHARCAVHAWLPGHAAPAETLLNSGIASGCSHKICSLGVQHASPSAAAAASGEAGSLCRRLRRAGLHEALLVQLDHHCVVDPPRGMAVQAA